MSAQPPGHSTSDPTAQPRNRTQPPIPAATSLPHPNPFLERIILFLMQYFLPVCSDPAVARGEILETLASYGGTSRSQVINAARIIAFSFAALETLSKSTEPGLSPSLRLRYKGCANNLNRSCQQNERMLAERLVADAAVTQAAAEPINDVTDTEVQAAIRHASAEIDTHRDRLSGPRAPVLPKRKLPPAQQEDHSRLWGNAMMTILGEMGMPVQPAGA